MQIAKVIRIITKLELGGAQEHAIYATRRIDREKFLPYLISGEEGILDEEARNAGAPFFQVPSMVREVRPLKDLTALISLARLIRRIKKEPPILPVVVHTHSSKAGILGRWAAYFAGADVVIHTYHGFGFNDWQRPIVRAGFVLVERITRPITDGFIAEAKAHIDKGLAEKVLVAENTELIRSGIPTKFFKRNDEARRKTRAQLGVADDAPLIGMVVCFKPQKAPVDFIEIAAIVLKSEPRARFIVAGDGELRGDIEAAIKRLGLGERVALLGWRRDLPDLMAAMDVLVLPSLWEGSPRVVPMAWSASLPVVATAVDGTAEAIEDGANGFLFKPRDVEAGAGKIIALLKDPALRAKIIDRAARDAVEYDEETTLKRIEEMYLKKLGTL